MVSCSPPRSLHPLSDPAQAKADPRLAGTWVGKIDEEWMYLHLYPKEGAALDLVLVGGDGKNGAGVVVFDAFPSVIAGRSYLNLRAKVFRGEYGSDPEILPDYIFARYAIAKDGALTLWHMDDEGPVKEALTSGALTGTPAAKGEDVRLTSDSATLAAFVARADPDKLFKRFGSFRRLATPAVRRGP
jgi:hypothetical protein